MRPFAFLLACIGILTGATALEAVQVEVTKADDKTVQISAGEDRKIQVGMTGDVYQQSLPIIHPVTGENLGSHKIRIARIQISRVGPDYAVGRYLVQYAPAKSGDVVEGLELTPTPQERLHDEVTEARSEIKSVARALADEIKSNQRAIEGLRQTLRSVSSSERRLNSMINDVKNVRERMVIIESRVTALEDLQKAILARDTAEVKKAISAGEIRVFRTDGTELDGLPRSGDEPVYIQIGDRKYSLSFKEGRADELPPIDTRTVDSSVPPALAGTAEPEGGLFEDESQMGEEEDAVPWYKAYWWIAPIVGVLGVAVVFLLKLMGRPQAGPDDQTGTVGEESFIEAADDEMIIEDDDLVSDLEEVELAEEEP